jgi:hypothetical protein
MLQKKDVAADERGGFAASIAKLTELVDYPKCVLTVGRTTAEAP